MATISPAVSVVSEVAKVVWTPITSADTAAAFTVGGRGSDLASIQITGTFGGATITLQGSNDGTNYVTLKDITGSAVSMTSAGLVDLRVAALYIKPVVSGGAAYTFTVTTVLRGK